MKKLLLAIIVLNVTSLMYAPDRLKPATITNKSDQVVWIALTGTNNNVSDGFKRLMPGELDTTYLFPTKYLHVENGPKVGVSIAAYEKNVESNAAAITQASTTIYVNEQGELTIDQNGKKGPQTITNGSNNVLWLRWAGILFGKGDYIRLEPNETIKAKKSKLYVEIGGAPNTQSSEELDGQFVDLKPHITQRDL
jgi:hypothetical protein